MGRVLPRVGRNAAENGQLRERRGRPLENRHVVPFRRVRRTQVLSITVPMTARRRQDSLGLERRARVPWCLVVVLVNEGVKLRLDGATTARVQRTVIENVNTSFQMEQNVARPFVASVWKPSMRKT